MEKQVVSTLEVPSPGVGAPTPDVGTYSLGIIGAGLVFVSGQGGIQPDGVIVDGIEAQTELALANIDAILRAAGSSLNRVVRFGVFLADITEWGKMNEVFERVLEKPYPARITVQAVLAQGMRIETDAIALAE